MLECENLSCARNNKVLFKNLSFKAELKSKILITGPNGSGKTSLIRSLSGLLPPVSGNIRHCRKDIYDDPKSYIPSMVYIGHKNACKDSLTVAQNVEFWAGIRNTRELIVAAICCLQLQPVVNIRYGELSAGWKRRVALARLLISNANVWLIDEPFCNLDSATCELVLNLISIRSEQNGIVIIKDIALQSNCVILQRLIYVISIDFLYSFWQQPLEIKNLLDKLRQPPYHKH